MATSRLLFKVKLKWWAKPVAFISYLLTGHAWLPRSAIALEKV
jgi:hypothetical protein